MTYKTTKGFGFVELGLPEFDRAGLPTAASEVIRPVNPWPNQAGYADEHGHILSPPELEAIGQATIRAAHIGSGGTLNQYPDLLGPPALAQREVTELVEYDVRESAVEEQL